MHCCPGLCSQLAGFLSFFTLELSYHALPKQKPPTLWQGNNTVFCICNENKEFSVPVHSHHHTLRAGLSDGLLDAGNLLTVHRPSNYRANNNAFTVNN